MKQITLEELLEAGCHFGHQVNRRNPKADEFIFEVRSNIHIINLEKTQEGLHSAAAFIKDIASKDGYMVVVGTKKQAKAIVKEEIERARAEGGGHIFYVNSRWVGGLLTNFDEVSKNFKKYKALISFLESGKKEEYTKREIILFQKEKRKLDDLYGGIFELERLPDCLLIIDTHHEETAVREALIKDVRTIGIVDTNADPSVIDYPIPANDDAVGSIKLIASYLIDAWIEGKLVKVAKEEITKNTKEKAVKKSKPSLQKTQKENKNLQKDQSETIS